MSFLVGAANYKWDYSFSLIIIYIAGNFPSHWAAVTVSISLGFNSSRLNARRKLTRLWWAGAVSARYLAKFQFCCALRSAHLLSVIYYWRWRRDAQRCSSTKSLCDQQKRNEERGFILLKHLQPRDASTGKFWSFYLHQKPNQVQKSRGLLVAKMHMKAAE